MSQLAVVFFFLFFFFSSPSGPVAVVVVTALPTGAAGCSGERGSVGGAHLQPPSEPNKVESSTLQQEELVVSYTPVGSDAQDGLLFLLTESSATTLSTSVEYVLQLQYDTYNADEYFEGFLFRLSSPDGSLSDTTTMLMVDDGGSGASTTTTPSQVAAVCTAANLGGVTHVDKEHKYNATALLVVDEPGEYELQVTAVFENGVEDDGTWASEWAYSTFRLEFQNDPVVGDTATNGAETSASTSSAAAASSAALLLLAALLVQ